MIFCTTSIVVVCSNIYSELRAHVTLLHFDSGALSKSDSNLDRNDLINHLNVLALIPVPRRLISAPSIESHIDHIELQIETTTKLLEIVDNN